MHCRISLLCSLLFLLSYVQITSLSNPGTFEANQVIKPSDNPLPRSLILSISYKITIYWDFQVKVGCCTVDVLKQLSGEEFSKNPSGVPTDRMSRLASHLLRQRRYTTLLKLFFIATKYSKMLLMEQLLSSVSTTREPPL